MSTRGQYDQVTMLIEELRIVEKGGHPDASHPSRLMIGSWCTHPTSTRTGLVGIPAASSPPTPAPPTKTPTATSGPTRGATPPPTAGPDPDKPLHGSTKDLGTGAPCKSRPNRIMGRTSGGTPEASSHHYRSRQTIHPRRGHPRPDSRSGTGIPAEMSQQPYPTHPSSYQKKPEEIPEKHPGVTYILIHPARLRSGSRVCACVRRVRFGAGAGAFGPDVCVRVLRSLRSDGGTGGGLIFRSDARGVGQHKPSCTGSGTFSRAKRLTDAASNRHTYLPCPARLMHRVRVRSATCVCVFFGRFVRSGGRGAGSHFGPMPPRVRPGTSPVPDRARLRDAPAASPRPICHVQARYTATAGRQEHPGSGTFSRAKRLTGAASNRHTYLPCPSG